MADIKSFPNRSPGANTTMATRGTVKSFGSKPDSSYKGLLRTLDSARKPANQNVRPKLSVTDPEFSSKPSNANKPPKGVTINSGKYAYGPKAPSTASKIASAAKGIAGGVARGAMRAAGPAGALASMTTPAGTGSDKPKGPLMTGNSKGKGPGGGSLSAPNRTAPSSSKMSVTGGRGVTAFGGSSGQAPKVAGGKGDLNSPYRTAPGIPARTTPSRSGGASNSKGPAGPSGPNSGPSRSGGASNSKGPAGPSGPNSGPSRSTGASASRGPSSGPTSAPSRTAPSKANLGTSRF
jgi:hypothetical protein